MISTDSELLISKIDCALVVTSPGYFEMDLFPKFSTTDVVTLDGNLLGGQCPGAHVIPTSRSGIELKTTRGKKKQKHRKKNANLRVNRTVSQ